MHVAVAPVTAANELHPGERIGFVDGSTERVSTFSGNHIGIVDPFLQTSVKPEQQFWMWLNPGSITSLRHDWTHPAFEPQADVATGIDALRLASEKWMRAWAVEHTPGNYYGESEEIDEDVAYEFAIDAGRETHIGPYEDARDHIDDEWWDHWQNITGENPHRGSYFSCSC